MSLAPKTPGTWETFKPNSGHLLFLCSCPRILATLGRGWSGASNSPNGLQILAPSWILGLSLSHHTGVLTGRT